MLTKTIGLSSKQVIADSRLKAIVGYVPYFGQPIFPAFGRDQKGLDGLTTPFLGIGGFSDTTAPIETTIQGVLRLHGSRELLGLEVSAISLTPERARHLHLVVDLYRGARSG
jgi:hypothetical protein